MAKFWSNITENATARRQVSINVPEMNEEEANLIYAEASYEAGVAAYIALDIRESIRAFGEEADARGFTAEEYIAEAFSFGGFFRKIFDFLVKMWNTIVNYIKALVGNKFGASGNIQKNVAKAIQGLVLIAAKEFNESAEIKVKDYKLREAAVFGKHLVNTDLYLTTPLLSKDKVTSKMWGSEAKGAFNLVNITKIAKYIAEGVVNDKVEKAVGVEDAGAGTKKELANESGYITKATEDIKAFTDKIGLGEKGAVESFLLLVEEAGIKALTSTIEAAKAKDAKSLTEFLRKLLGYFFAGDANVRTLKGGAQMKGQAAILATVLFNFGEITGKSAVDGAMGTGKAADVVKDLAGTEAPQSFGDLTKIVDKLSSTNVFNAIVDPIKENLKRCEDILAELRKAAEDIKSVSASDTTVGSEKNGEFKADKDQKPAEERATALTAFGDKLLVLESAMQQVVTKGMDAGSVILETVSKEILGQVELLLKATSEKRKAASVDNM